MSDEREESLANDLRTLAASALFREFDESKCATMVEYRTDVGDEKPFGWVFLVKDERWQARIVALCKVMEAEEIDRGS